MGLTSLVVRVGNPLAYYSNQATVLVVEDDMKMADGLSRLLEGAGHVVKTAVSARDALAACSGFEPTSLPVTIVDVRLDGEDKTGLDLLLALKEKMPGIAPIIMTAYPSVEVAQAAVRAGAIRYITKPFSLEDMLEAVDAALEKQRESSRELRTIALEFLVDSGATFSVVPKPILEDLNIMVRSERRFLLANGGTVKRNMGVALFRYGTVEAVSNVIFGAQSDSTLLGAHTLESLGMQLDPTARQVWITPLPLLMRLQAVR